MRVVALVLLLVVTIGAMPIASVSADVFDPKDYQEFVIQVEDGVDPIDHAEFFLSRLDVAQEDHFRERVHHIYRTAITGYSLFLTETEWRKAERLDLTGFGIKSITESYMGQVEVGPITEVEGQMPTHPLANDREVIPTNIQRIGALPDGTDYSSVDVAVIDTGVDRMHPDLNVVGGIDCVAATGDTPDYGVDGYGHGTHVAGTIGARNNGVGVVGVAPGARIWSAKVLDSSGRGSFASVICGIDWAAQNADDLEVANMSLGGIGSEGSCDGNDPMHAAICVLAEKTIVVVAAGNSSADASGHVPAAYDEVVTVSAWSDFDGQAGGGGVAPQNGCYAMSRDDDLASFTNYGMDVDIAAPGVCVLSTLPGTLIGVGGYSPEWGYASGTSMASPAVAGCFARFLAANADQREWARQQILTYSESHGTVVNDPDGFNEPLLFCDNVPRYEGSDLDYDPDQEVGV